MLAVVLGLLTGSTDGHMPQPPGQRSAHLHQRRLNSALHMYTSTGTQCQSVQHSLHSSCLLRADLTTHHDLLDLGGHINVAGAKAMLRRDQEGVLILPAGQQRAHVGPGLLGSKERMSNQDFWAAESTCRIRMSGQQRAHVGP